MIVEILTIKEAERQGTNMKVIDFKEFAWEMKRYTTKFSFEALKVLFDYFSNSCGSETTTYYGHWSQYYSECSFEEFARIINEEDCFDYPCHEATKESILEYLKYRGEGYIDNVVSFVGLTDSSVVYFDRKKYLGW